MEHETGCGRNPPWKETGREQLNERAANIFQLK